MVRNVRKSTYFRSGHVLNSKEVSEPCKQLRISSTIDPNMIKISQNTCTILDTLKLYIRVIAHTCTRESAVNSFKQVVTAAKLNARQHGSLEMAIVNGCPVSQQVCTLKNTKCSMAMSSENKSNISSLNKQNKQTMFQALKLSSKGVKRYLC